MCFLKDFCWNKCAGTHWHLSLVAYILIKKALCSIVLATKYILGGCLLFGIAKKVLLQFGVVFILSSSIFLISFLLICLRIAILVRIIYRQDRLILKLFLILVLFLVGVLQICHRRLVACTSIWSTGALVLIFLFTFLFTLVVAASILRI